MWETVDADGRRVVLTFERWRHIVEEHPDLASWRNAILATIADPVGRHGGHVANEEWLYGLGFGPTRFVRVVVHFDAGIGRVTTAFPRRRKP